MPTLKTCLILSTLGIALTGCGGGDSDFASGGGKGGSCSNAFNPASNVIISLSSFELSDPADLEHTLFRDFIRGIQPAVSDPTSTAVVDSVMIETARFNGGENTDSNQNNFTSVRNPADLINNQIGTNEIDNFNQGRRYISDCIDASTAAEYSNSANGVGIRFDEAPAGTPVDRYNYALLRWVYAPQGSNKIQKVVQYVGTADDFLDGIILAEQYDPTNFSSVGFNTPDRASVSFTGGNDTERLGFDQDLISDKQDSWTRSSDTPFTFAGASVDCARVVVDYPMATATVYTSVGVDQKAEGYCGTKTASDNTYSTAPVASRQ
ncbi:hypothetical protein [Marinobacter sp. BGYM27]|uniref:hypothetical protein n=1 Tax=Marinobacter sp. BGYM27 TaxID=2975597 RepID=UPI0021A84193|nr:hypothetical protein [Marinobacter sp. BGYM27]MDG5500145.1 hypothetical protein [Marinobacter sp. BGYM27]